MNGGAVSVLVFLNTERRSAALMGVATPLADAVLTTRPERAVESGNALGVALGVALDAVTFVADSVGVCTRGVAMAEPASVSVDTPPLAAASPMARRRRTRTLPASSTAADKNTTKLWYSGFQFLAYWPNGNKPEAVYRLLGRLHRHVVEQFHLERRNGRKVWTKCAKGMFR